MCPFVRLNVNIEKLKQLVLSLDTSFDKSYEAYFLSLPDAAFASTSTIGGTTQQQPQRQQQQAPIFLNVQENFEGCEIKTETNSFILGTISNFSR